MSRGRSVEIVVTHYHSCRQDPRLTDAWLLSKWCVEIDTPAVACSRHATLPTPAGRAARSATGCPAAGLLAHLNTALAGWAVAPGPHPQGAHPPTAPPLPQAHA